MNTSELRRPGIVALISLAVVIVFYVLREHWGHALGALPYLILLACPLMHLFHGHGGHHGEHRSGGAATGSRQDLNERPRL